MEQRSVNKVRFKKTHESSNEQGQRGDNGDHANSLVWLWQLEFFGYHMTCNGIKP